MDVEQLATNGNPEAFRPILGSTFISEITDSKDHAVLRIGKDAFSKHEVATVLGVTHTVSCGILTAVCKRLGVTSVKDLYQKTSPYTFADKKVGVTTLYVMFAAFRSKGLSVADWIREGYGEKATVVTWHTYKKREADAAARERKDNKRRGRRNGPSTMNLG